MNLGKASLKYRTNMLVLTVVFVAGGLISYQKMGRLEDPEFTIKQAQVITPYPGASAEEVEQQVTETIEKAVQQLGQIDYVKSSSSRGMSYVDVMIKDNYNKNTLPQVWDELRRKISDVQRSLPQGAGPSIVYDDFGDVFGIFFAITGDGYSLTELKEAAKFIQRELLTVRDVAKVDLIGVQPEVIYIEISPVKMAQFGISREQIYQTLQSKNLTVDSGEVHVGNRRIALNPTGKFTAISEIKDLVITANSPAGTNQSSIFLHDIATVTQAHKAPPDFAIRVDGKPAIGIAISTVSGGNVVIMGEAVKQRMESIIQQRLIPFGIEYHKISIQSEAVNQAISGFVNSLIQAVVIVIVVLLIFMGIRSGIIIGAVLLITIIGSFVFMYAMGIMLERISLGALIIALGMLVDNAIVITEGMLIRIQRGEDKTEAANKVVGQNALPLLGATLVAILAFAAIGASNDSSGEYTRSLFQVIMISLLFSWLTAVTVTPIFCAMLLKPKAIALSETSDYNGHFFQLYRTLLQKALRHRSMVIISMLGLLALSFIAFGKIETAFFPNSTRPQLMVDLWLPEGTHFDETARQATEAENILRQLKHVTAVTTFLGQGPPRYLLTLSPESPNTSYAHFLLSVDDYRVIDTLMKTIQNTLEERFPDTIPQAYKFALGPGVANKIQVRVQGANHIEIRNLADSIMQVMCDDGRLIGIQTDWRQMVIEYQPILKDTQARELGIGRIEVANLLKETFDGRKVGALQKGDETLPILVRAPKNERQNIGFLDSLTIQSPITGLNIPLAQITSGYETSMVNAIIKRRDRMPTITIKCNPREGNASKALARIMPSIDNIKIPQGCHLTYGGEYEDSNKANAALKNKVLFCGLLMILIVIMLFNALRQPLIICLCIPLALIGVTLGLLVTGQPFGFMALLGLLSLSGMLIKNAIVLIDEIDLQRRQNRPILDAIIYAGLSRARPVMMASATTVLGMAPLIFDAFFVAMAVTIMAGLTFATILTLFIVPVLYATLFRAEKHEITS